MQQRHFDFNGQQGFSPEPCSDLNDSQGSPISPMAIRESKLQNIFLGKQGPKAKTMMFGDFRDFTSPVGHTPKSYSHKEKENAQLAQAIN